MTVLDFIRNVIGAIIFALGGLLVMIAYPILAASGRRWVKDGILKGIAERLLGTPANKSTDIVTARVDPRKHNND